MSAPFREHARADGARATRRRKGHRSACAVRLALPGMLLRLLAAPPRLQRLCAAPPRLRAPRARCLCMATPLQKIIHDGGPGGAGWEVSWRESVTPWDAGTPAPSLVKLVRDGALPRGRALVPGVGAGYDALALVSSDRSVVGLDLAPTAVGVATARRDAAGVSAQQCAFVAGDFFTHDLGAPFQLVWEYTFLCALDVELRPRWAARMRELLGPDGLLVTLIFPVSDHAGGPPYAVSPQLYQQARGVALSYRGRLTRQELPRSFWATRASRSWSSRRCRMSSATRHAGVKSGWESGAGGRTQLRRGCEGDAPPIAHCTSPLAASSLCLSPRSLLCFFLCLRGASPASSASVSAGAACSPLRFLRLPPASACGAS